MGIDFNKMEVVAVIADNGSLSGEVSVPAGMMVCGMEIPAGWLTAPVTFQNRCSGGALCNVRDEDGVEFTVASVAASAFVAFNNLNPLMSFRHFKVRSGTAASPVSQTGGPLSIRFVLREA